MSDRFASGSEVVYSNVEMFSGDRTRYTWGDAQLLALNILENVLRAQNYRGGLYDSEQGVPAPQCGTCYRVAYGLAGAFTHDFLDDVPLDGAEIRYEAICRWMERQFRRAGG